jgi:hypothetical protein
MNERIKELAEQAGITLPADTAYNGHIYRNALEKFANSIVRECAALSMNNPGHNGLNISDKIIKHFGVKE